MEVGIAGHDGLCKTIKEDTGARAVVLMIWGGNCDDDVAIDTPVEELKTIGSTFGIVAAKIRSSAMQKRAEISDTPAEVEKPPIIRNAEGNRVRYAGQELPHGVYYSPVKRKNWQGEIVTYEAYAIVVWIQGKNHIRIRTVGRRNFDKTMAELVRMRQELITKRARIINGRG